MLRDKVLSTIESTVDLTRDGRSPTSLNIQRRREVSTSNSVCMWIENSSLPTDSQTVYSSVIMAVLACSSSIEDT